MMMRLKEERPWEGGCEQGDVVSLVKSIGCKVEKVEGG